MKRRKQESGFALLLVFALAAVLAISLYIQLPRAAFEAQRNKEEMLIERGEQYKRAVQLYYSKNKKFPQSMDELEKTGEIRYLRKRYTDPMTGKDEWRVIHTNGLVLTDSVIKKKDEKKENVNTFVTETASIGGSNSPDAGGVNLALRRRPSDQAPGTGAPTDPNALPPLPPLPGDPNSQQQQQPVQQQPQPGQQSQQANNGPSPFGGGGGFGQQGQQQQGFPGQPGQPGVGPPSNQAIDLIGKILTSPRQGPNQPGLTVGTPLSCPSGTCIAGVASKMEMPSIKLYNERQKYNEWEFAYELKADKRLMRGALGEVMDGSQPKQLNQGLNQGLNPGGVPSPITGFGSFGQGQNQNQSPGQNTNTTTAPASGSSGGSGGFITAGPSIGSAPPATTTNPNQTPNPNPNPNPQLPGFPNPAPGPQPPQRGPF